MIASYSPRFRLALGAVFFGALVLAMMLMRATAHAQGVAIPVAAPPSTDPLAVAGVILGGLALILTGAHAIFQAIAGRTKNTIDDRIRDGLAEVIGFIRGLPIPPPAINRAVPEPGKALDTMIDRRPPQSGRVNLHILGMLLGGAMLLYGVTGACTKQQVATGVRAGLGCERPGIAAAAGELYAWASERIAAAIAGGKVDSAKLREAMTNVLDASPRCAIEAVIAGMATTSARATGPTVDGSALRLEFERLKSEMWQ